MKGLMVALLTLLTASFAAAQQEDDGGTFVLRLNEENFRALLQNKKGLIAPIPESARGKITKVVVKLEDAVRNDEINRMNSTKPGLDPSSQVPSLDPGTTARRPSVTQDGGFRNPIQNRNNDRGIQPSIQIPFRAPERFTDDRGFEQVDQQARTSSQPFLQFGDDSDFTPVVNRDWLSRDRATLEQRNGLGQFNNTEGFRQRNDGLNQANNTDWQRQRILDRQPEIPTFDQNRFQNRERDRTNDLASRDLRIQDRNNVGVRNQTTQQDNGLLQEYQDTLRNTQTVMNNQQTAINQKDAEIENLKLQILRERNEAAARQSANNTDPLSQVVHNGRLGNGGSYTNYGNAMSQTGYETPPQDRIARNDRQPNVNSNGVPTLQIQGKDDQPSPGDNANSASGGQPIVNTELAGKNQSLRKANNFLLFMLLASVGLNIYLGLISRTFYTRYEELADELRETFTATM